MTFARRLAIGCLALIATSSAALATSVTSTVTVIFVGPDDHVAWFSTATMPSQPACATAGRWAFDLSTPQGQATFATIQTALATGRSIYVEGKGGCTVWGDSEDLWYVAAR